MNRPPNNKLSPGQTLPQSIRISAKDTGTDTTVDMAPGEEYELTATGLWWDLYIPSSPNGFFFLQQVLVERFLPEFLVERFFRPRHRASNFFALIGCLDRRPDQQFFIGKYCKYTPAVAGRLFCFANDVPGFYWNNWGKVDLTIKRLS